MAQDERQGTPESELASTVTQDFSHDEEMQDVDSFLVATNTPRRRESFDPVALQAPSRFQYSTMHIDENMMTSDTRVLNPASKTGSPISMSEKFVAEPPLVLPTSSGSPRLNFPHVYKQRRKLEDNWDAGRYKPFQLPHRDYAEEAHSECVYTIQHMGNYLVSGSRDRSLRIWDLDSQRLARKPLLGHTGSVLCLQFDASEKEDIIISGSSDTDVILWRFSTGKMIQKIGQAHRESVLNLKFDERFLVTCSKDKTIKIWNRQELRPGDRDYPVKGIQSGGRCPAYIVDLRNFGGPRDIEDHLTPEQKEPLQPYTTLMILDSHGAAVNAIHIQNDQLVSASGDRNLKVWDIHTGVCTAVCRGHMKGIACVQYDGKRIVSGSSDNTIRIFDPISTAEVACLKGHTKLVRTVQSAFGDLPGSREQLELDASAVDRDYYEARRLGKLATTSERTRERNAGSRQPKDIMALGAKIPPGGGGSRWGRIVSGSYDETIIVWKKALDESTWVIAHRLRQGEALQAAGPPLLAHSDRQPPAMPPAWAGWQRFISARAGVLGPAQPFQPQPQPQTTAGPSTQAPMPATQIVQHAMQTGAAALQTGMQNIASINAHLTNTPAGSNTPPFNTLPAHLQASMQQIHSQQQVYLQQLAQQQTQQRQLAAPNQQVPQPTNHPPPPPPVQAPPPLPTIQQIAPHAPQAFPPHPNLALAANTATAAPIGPQPNARVFKLQFDARRIICCSQDPKIVGWDFANDDEEIVACSRFFAQPQ
ncbi:hypothetical protein MMC12_008683 [Toensbergia leucococca]|nr:hypothetical protein [Toensbergia leucococca]